MRAVRQRYAESLNPFTAIAPADRVPSHGTQLSADGTADLSARTGRPVPTFGQPSRPAAPVALNLWDTSADSIPETWSTDR